MGEIWRGGLPHVRAVVWGKLLKSSWMSLKRRALSGVSLVSSWILFIKGCKKKSILVYCPLLISSAPSRDRDERLATRQRWRRPSNRRRCCPALWRPPWCSWWRALTLAQWSPTRSLKRKKKMKQQQLLRRQKRQRVSVRPSRPRRWLSSSLAGFRGASERAGRGRLQQCLPFSPLRRKEGEER